jgi:hypothetical protein
MKRRKCTCGLIEPSEIELRWTGDRCPICEGLTQRRAEAQPPKPPAKIDDERALRLREWRREHMTRIAKERGEQAREVSKVEPGLCQKCGERKPESEFPKRTKSEPDWYPHHQRCKECVCEGVKDRYRKRWLEQLRDELPTRTVRNIHSEIRFTRQRLRAMLDELERREARESKRA